MTDTKSILSQVRGKAYGEGYSQGSMQAYDNAYVKGAEDEARLHEGIRMKWWVFGVVCGASVSTIFFMLT